MTTPNQSSHRVLLVSGDPASRNSLKPTLESVLLEVELVSQADAALELLKNESFGLVIVDASLPRLDALELLREMRRSHASILRRTIVLVNPHDPICEKILPLEPCHMLERLPLRHQLIHAVSDCLRQQESS